MISLSEFPLRINCGSDKPWTDPDGNVWQADTPIGELCAWLHEGGGKAPREADLPLYPPRYGELLRTERVNPDNYQFKVDSGYYRIELVVGETFEALSSHAREFSVTVNGVLVVESVCPFAIGGGHGRAGLVVVDGVHVGEDGMLCIAFGDKALVNGMCLQPSPVTDLTHRFDTLAPNDFTPTEAIRKSDASSPVRILFIGHSGTFFWAIPETLQRMCAMGPSPYRLEIDSAYSGGKNCQFFFEWDVAREKLQSASWDYVVIQDSSRGPINEPDVFSEFMPRLIELVKSVGATPILYAYSCPEAHSSEQRQGLYDLYAQVGATFEAAVVPCALAMRAVLARYPDQNFHNPDRHHSGLLAGYLFACVFYSAMTGQSAADLPEYTTLAGHVSVPDVWGKRLGDMASAICRDEGLKPILAQLPLGV